MPSFKQGPQSGAMYDVMKAAIQALNEVNPAVLNDAKQHHSGKYDRVKTLLGGELSLNNNGYAKLARSIGTIKDQPGYLVDQIILRADHLLRELSQKYPVEVQQNDRRLRLA